MKRFVEGVDRGQSTLFPECLEDWIIEDKEMAKLATIEAQMLAAPDQQVSLTDPDSRSMATSGRGSGVEFVDKDVDHANGMDELREMGKEAMGLETHSRSTSTPAGSPSVACEEQPKQI